MTPLVVYVLWHPAAEQAALLAAAVYRWFHAASDDLLRSGMGVPVYFRSSAPGSDSGAAPAPIETDFAELNVLVVLAESEMVASPPWRAYISELAARPRTLTVPVALQNNAYRLPQSLRRLNFLRLDERDDPADAGEAARLARRVPRLLSQLTEVVCRRLAARLSYEGERDDASGRSAPPPLSIFLSHAKRDGVEVAEALRSVIEGKGRLRAFFDDSELPVGHAFASELEHASTVGSAAMIAVLTDAYAARPWCRREIALARAPRREAGHPNCWSMLPVLAVDHLQGAPTRGIPELGNATLLRWNPALAAGALDLLMLEVLLAGYHRLRAREVPALPGRHVVSWTPDLPTLLALQRQAPDVVEVCHPGHALPKTDSQSLRQAFPAMRFLTFEEAEQPNVLPARALAGRLIGLSTGYNEDLGSLGLGREHLEEATLRVARCLVEGGATLAFGGLLDTSGLTETLLTLVRTITGNDDDGQGEPQARILSFQRWPALPSKEQIAADTGICDYVLVDSPLPPAHRLAEDRRFVSPERMRQHALALLALREAMSRGGARSSSGRVAAPLAARVVIGGLRTGSNGCLPGVIEEALYALEAGQPVYVIGGWGGGAGVLARAIFGQPEAGRSCEPELTSEFHRERSARFVLLEHGLAAHGEEHLLADLFARLIHAIDDVRADPAGALGNGLDGEENRRLMFSSHLSEVVSLMRLGLSRSTSVGGPD